MRFLTRLRSLFGVANVRKPVKPAGKPALKPLVQEVVQVPARVKTPAPALPTGVKAANEALNTFDRAAFFARLREGPLRHHRPEQVKGTEAILDACTGLPISWVAYACATAWHETGGNMSPNVESLNYSVAGLLNTFGRHRISRADAERLGRKPGEGPLPLVRQRAIANILYGGEWGRVNLGNTEPDDGWVYRGRGMDHCTGRRNYSRAGNTIGVDFLSNPDALLSVDCAAKVMVSGMKTGRYRNVSFAARLPTTGTANATEFGAARDIINGGRDKAGEIAAHALTFQRALQAGGWK